MKVRYDPRVDALTIALRSGRIAESEERASGVIVDLDASGGVLSIEILDASRRLDAASAAALASAAGLRRRRAVRPVARRKRSSRRA